MAPMGRDGSGQAAPEYVAAVLLLATLFASILALAGPALPGGALARAVAAKLVCAVGREGCSAGDGGPLSGERSPLARAYGAAVAAMVAERAPEISFEEGDFVSLPVDPRECRSRSCSDSIRRGSLSRTQTGLPPVAFTHVVDCRHPGAAAEAGYDCSGSRSGRVYLQYWLYYPDSNTGPASSVTGAYHTDDWESYQVRIEPDGSAMARASSHHGYNGRSGGIESIGSDTGKLPKPGWDTVLGELHVAAGSHAGMSQALPGDTRRIPSGALVLIPLEPIVRGGEKPHFEVTPPWEKGVWTDPESMTT